MAARQIDCGEHGKKPWREHAACADCGRVYDLNNAPYICGCGSDLRESARAICADCYEQRKREGKAG